MTILDTVTEYGSITRPMNGLHAFIACAALAYVPVVRAVKAAKKGKDASNVTVVQVALYLLSAMVSFVGFMTLSNEDSSKIYSLFSAPESMKSASEQVVTLFCLTRALYFVQTLLSALNKKSVGFAEMYYNATITLVALHAYLSGADYMHLVALPTMAVSSVVDAGKAVSLIVPEKAGKVLPMFTQGAAIALSATVACVLGAAASADEPQSIARQVSLQFGVVMHIVTFAAQGSDFIHNFAKGWRPHECVLLFLAHVFAVVGIYKTIMAPKVGQLSLEIFILWQVGGMGITVGAHRLWSHRSYQAAWPARFLIMIMNSFASQGTILHWARDHRTHHHHSETESDPHNAKRGFWYSHIGWLLLDKPEEVKVAGRKIDCKDLYADWVVMLQRNCDPWWNLTFCWLVPAVYCMAVHGSFWTGFFALGGLRWIITLHFTWAVNSFAHLYGDRPYSPKINPAENIIVTLGACGEGWHNWHHAFPFDYAASELGADRQYNPSKMFIDALASVGQVWGRKKATKYWDQQRDRLDREAQEREVTGEPAPVYHTVTSGRQYAGPLIDSFHATVEFVSALRPSRQLKKQKGIVSSAAAPKVSKGMDKDVRRRKHDAGASSSSSSIWKGLKETARVAQYAVDDTPVYNN